jgi:RHS repeat-associated protein
LDEDGVPVKYRLSVFGAVSGEGPLGLPGQFPDEPSKSSYNLLRNYVPEFGQYLQFDRFWRMDGSNGYAYASLNPLKFMDPIGATSFSFHPPPYRPQPNHYGTIGCVDGAPGVYVFREHIERRTRISPNPQCAEVMTSCVYRHESIHLQHATASGEEHCGEYWGWVNELWYGNGTIRPDDDQTKAWTECESYKDTVACTRDSYCSGDCPCKGIIGGFFDSSKIGEACFCAIAGGQLEVPDGEGLDSFCSSTFLETYPWPDPAKRCEK